MSSVYCAGLGAFPVVGCGELTFIDSRCDVPAFDND